MTLKQLTVVMVLVAALVAGVIGVQLSQKNDDAKADESRRGKQVFPELPLDKVESISVIKKDSTVTLAKSDKGWNVAERGSYSANFPDIRTLLLDIAELKIIDVVDIAPEHFGLLNLQDPSKEDSEEKKTATKVELGGGEGKTIATLYIGKEPQNGVQSQARGTETKSVYVRVEGQDGVFLVNKSAPAPETPPGGFPVSALSGWLSYDAEPSDWINKAFFNVSKTKTIEVKHPVAEDSWKVVKTPPAEDEVEDKWDLVDLEPGMELDIDSKASGIRYLLTNPSFREVVTTDKAKELDWTKEPISAVITTDDDFKYELTMIKIDPEGTSSDLYLKVNTSAELPDKRPAVEGESDEVKLRNDANYAADLPRLKAKLEKEKAFNGWVFEVSEHNVSTLLKKRPEIIKEKEKEPEEPTEPTDPTDPTDPTKPIDPTPIDPTKPADPGKPEEPTKPVDPTKPVEPDTPTDPTKPDEPAPPTDPAKPDEPSTPSDPTKPTDSVDPPKATEPTTPADPPKPVEPPSSPEAPEKPEVPETAKGDAPATSEEAPTEDDARNGTSS